MLSEKVLDAINAQINHELYSAYLYLSMSAHLEALNFPGLAKWTRMQAAEEQEHAMKFFDYVNDRGGRVTLKAIAQPPVEFGAPLDVFTAILEHEEKVTSLINALYEKAVEAKDYATQVMLHWFISEQVEEEKNASTIIEQLRTLDGPKAIIMHVDHRLGKRGED